MAKKKQKTTTVETVETPVVETPVQPTKFLLMPTNVAAIANLVDKRSTSRWGGTSGINVTSLNGGDKYQLDATNGSYFGRVVGASESSEEYPPIPALQSAPNGATTALVQSKSFVNACKQVPKRSIRGILTKMAVKLGDDVTTMASTDCDTNSITQPRNVEGKFPNGDAVLDAFNDDARDAVKIKLDVKKLIELLQVAKEFTDGENNEIILEVIDESRAMRVTARHNENDQDFTSLIMPVYAQTKKGK